MVETHFDMAQAADRIENCVEAREFSRARVLLDRILSTLGGDVEVFREPSQVSFYAGFTHVCIKLKRFDRAMHFAGLGLLRDARDIVLHAMLSESQKLYFAQEFIRRGWKTTAILILELARETKHSLAVAHMLGMLEYFEAEQARIRMSLPHRPQSGRRRPLLMSVIVWGADHVRSFLSYSLPSLMAAGNIPRCARDREVILDIYTTAADRETIENSAAGIAAARNAILQFNIIPDALLYQDSDKVIANSDRWCVGGAQLCSALRAWRLGADLTFITSSGVYSNDCFASASTLIDDGYAVVMVCTMRVREPELHGALRQYADITAARIDIDPVSLVAFIVENLHPHFRNLFLSDPPRRARQDPTTLFFKTPSGYASRTFQPAPLLISHDLLRGDFRFDYMTTDARFVAELFRDRDPDSAIKIAENPGDGLVVADVDGGVGTDMKEYGEIPVTLEITASCVLNTAYRESDLRFYAWLLRRRFAVTAVDGGHLPDSGVDEREAIDRLLELVRQGSAPVIEKIQMYEKFAKLDSYPL